jgi:hypothetical protein
VKKSFNCYVQILLAYRLWALQRPRCHYRRRARYQRSCRKNSVLFALKWIADVPTLVALVALRLGVILHSSSPPQNLSVWIISRCRIYRFFSLIGIFSSLARRQSSAFRFRFCFFSFYLFICCPSYSFLGTRTVGVSSLVGPRIPAMSRPEIHDRDSPSGDRDQRHRPQTISSLSFNSVQYRPPTTQWSMDRREKSALMSPHYSFSGSQAVQGHYGSGGNQVDNGSDVSVNNISHPLQFDSFPAPNHAIPPPFASPPSFVRPTNMGYPFPAPSPFAVSHSPLSDRDNYFNRQHPHPNQSNIQSNVMPKPTAVASEAHYTLRWGDLEPWMDEEYAKQVCKILSWDPISVKVSRPPPDPVTGRQLNNPGYCFLSFASHSQAAAALSQVQSGSIIMPNSTKPFVLNWAPSIPASPPIPSTPTHAAIQAQAQAQAQPVHMQQQQQQQQPFTKEYSIFVGDLAPEVSNSDLVAVFRNPVLGLRNDREPRFIRPFSSCKSAKIMLDPVTGVSRGYGFVRHAFLLYHVAIMS